MIGRFSYQGLSDSQKLAQGIGDDYFSKGMYRQAIDEYVVVLVESQKSSIREDTRETTDMRETRYMREIRDMRKRSLIVFHLQLHMKIIASYLEIQDSSKAINYFITAVPLMQGMRFKTVADFLGEQAKDQLEKSLKSEFEKKLNKAYEYLMSKEDVNAILIYRNLSDLIGVAERNPLAYMSYISSEMTFKTYTGLAVCHMNMKEFPEAIICFRDAIRLGQPDSKQLATLNADIDRCKRYIDERKRKKQLETERFQERLKAEKAAAERLALERALEQKRLDDERLRVANATHVIEASQALTAKNKQLTERARNRNEQKEAIEQMYQSLHGGSSSNQIAPESLGMNLGQLLWWAKYSKPLTDKVVTLILHFYDDEAIKGLVDNLLRSGFNLYENSSSLVGYGGQSGKDWQTDKLIVRKIAEHHKSTMRKLNKWDKFVRGPFRSMPELFFRMDGDDFVSKSMRTNWWYDQMGIRNISALLSHNQFQGEWEISVEDLAFIDSLEPTEAHVFIGSNAHYQMFCYRFGSHVVLFRSNMGVCKDLFIVEGTGEWGGFLRGVGNKVFDIEESRVVLIVNESWKEQLEKVLNVQGYRKPTPDQYMLDWEVLPPGCFEDDKQFYMLEQKLNMGRSSTGGSLVVDRERLRFIEGLGPIASYLGGNLLSGRSYTVFVFDDYVVADCPDEGNAIYIINGTDDWRELLKGSKAELRRVGGSRVRRIIHTGTWHTRLIDAINA